MRRMNTDGKSPRILIVRLSTVGDAIQTMPIAWRYGIGFPRRFWLGRSIGGPRRLLRGASGIDELIELPRGWLKSPGERVAAAPPAANFRFDVTIDVQSHEVGHLRVALGRQAADRVRQPRRTRGQQVFNHERVDPSATHVVDRYLELLGRLGIESPAVRFQVPEHGPDCHGRAGGRFREAAMEGALQSSIPAQVGRQSSGRPSATRRWPAIWGTDGVCRRSWFGPANRAGAWPRGLSRRVGRRRTLLRRRRLPVGRLARQARLFMIDPIPAHCTWRRR